MRFGYEVRASLTMLRHPWQGVERIRGRIDRRRDKRQLSRLGVRASDLYGAVADWQPRLHGALDLPWPCEAVAAFGQVWDRVVAELADSGVHVGRASYGGWNDGDRAFAEAIWCIVAHLRPTTVVETGVAHGVTSRVILQGLERNGSGHLWSIDLPAVDPALHREIGIAVSEDLRHRWTYVQGTSRQRLPHLLTQLGELRLFIHDSLHTGRNVRFELASAWAAMPPGGVAVVDDIDHSLGFRNFLDQARPKAWFAARHVTGGGLWGVTIKAAKVERSSHSPALRVLRKRQPVGRRLGGGQRISAPPRRIYVPQRSHRQGPRTQSGIDGISGSSGPSSVRSLACSRRWRDARAGSSRFRPSRAGKPCSFTISSPDQNVRSSTTKRTDGLPRPAQAPISRRWILSARISRAQGSLRRRGLES
jgi:hypothetical protein